MTLPPGTRLGPYEIVAPLGEGGMGEVFRARDTRLNRTVAIKTLRPDVAAEPERRARFEREARAIAALSHPHICTLHDVGAAEAAGDEVEFLVMELVEGETLADRLARGPLPFTETLAFGIQIADALDCAHRQGIVHRDLKPSNIMLTTSGVKLLDFGLARLRAAETPVVDGTDGTQTAALTASGVILGTLQYIAPEQLEGRDVDGRADLFALGAILYEMAAGRRAFDGETPAALVSAIMSTEPPPPSTIDPSLPRAFERIVTVCLAKRPDQRWSSAHDVALLLKGIEGFGDVGPRPEGRAYVRDRPYVRWVALGASAAAIVFAALLLFRHTPAAPALDVFSILPAPDTTLMPGEAPQVSPDGRHVAFVAVGHAGSALLYVYDRGAFAPRALDGTENAMMPFWSPDGASIGFFAGGRLKRIPASGGTPQTLAVAPVPRGGTWSRNDTIMFVPFPAQAPHTIAASGGTPVPVPVSEKPAGRFFPSFLPDGHHYVYMAVGPARLGDAATLRLGTIDDAGSTPLVASSGSGVYADPGYLMFRREQSLVIQPFDSSRLELGGTPSTILERAGYNSVTYQTLVSASAGALAYAATTPAEQLVWFDRAGRQLGAASPAGGYNSVCLSADGRRMIYDTAAPGADNLDLWSAPIDGGTPERLTFDSSVDFYVACSGASNEVVFATLRRGSPMLYRLKTDAPGSEKPLLNVPGPMIPTDWSPDGRYVVYSRFDPTTRWDVWVLPLAAGTPTAVLTTGAEERNARLSPDGRWLAYTSDETGTLEVYVQPFPATGAKWQVSRGGGQQSVWSPDGRELFYISPGKQIVGVNVTASGAVFGTSAPHVVVDARVGGWERTNQGSPYAITPDGQRLVVSRETEAARPIGVVLNWVELTR